MYSSAVYGDVDVGTLLDVPQTISMGPAKVTSSTCNNSFRDRSQEVRMETFAVCSSQHPVEPNADALWPLDRQALVNKW